MCVASHAAFKLSNANTQRIVPGKKVSRAFKPRGGSD